MRNLHNPSSCFSRPFVKVHISRPYRTTDSTTVRNTLILVYLCSCDFQSLLSLLHVLQAAVFLHFTSTLVLLVMEPRYLKSFMTSSMVPSRVAIWTGSSWLYTWHLVFLALAFNPMLRDSVISQTNEEMCMSSILTYDLPILMKSYVIYFHWFLSSAFWVFMVI